MASIFTLTYPSEDNQNNETITTSFTISDVSLVSVANEFVSAFSETYDDLFLTSKSELLASFIDFIGKSITSSSQNEVPKETKEKQVQFLNNVSTN